MIEIEIKYYFILLIDLDLVTSLMMKISQSLIMTEITRRLLLL